MDTKQTAKQFSLDDLCALTDLPKRTVRYYMQIGLVDRPEGETRGAFYLPRHLDQLVQVKRLAQAGVNLERIREVLEGAQAPLPERMPAAGDIAVKSHVHIAPGIELSIDSQRAGVSPESLREFIKVILSAAEKLKR